jgi:predicted RNA-binding protein
MNYWLFITNPENWAVTKEKKVLGYAKRYEKALSRVHNGDRCLVYVTKDSIVNGEYEINSDVYYDKKRIFHAAPTAPAESFPLRLKLKLITPSPHQNEFKPLVAILSFIKNKKKWAGTFQGNACSSIPEQDYRIIISSLRRGL